MKFTVGGRPLDLTHEQVSRAMAGEEPEPIREHLVEMQQAVFPPKQVFAAVTWWERQSFTTLEAQRVLTKLGFVCRRASALPAGEPAWIHVGESEPEDSSSERMAAIEAALVTAQVAIAGLHTRVAVLESGA